MSLNLKIGLVIIIVLTIFIIITNIRKGKLQLSFSIFSIITGIALIIALMIPSLLERLANFLGFEVTSNMLFLFSIFMIFYLIFTLMIILSGEYKRSVKLIQEVSILKERISELEEKYSSSINK